MHTYRKKVIYSLFSFVIIFTFTFILGLIYLKNDIALLEVGLKPSITNWIIIIFSVLSLIKALIEMSKVESAEEFEQRIKTKNI